MVKESVELTPGEAIVEPISNNMGITLAMTGVVKGHQVKLLIPEWVSLEGRCVLEVFNAEVVLAPENEGIGGCTGGLFAQRMQLAAGYRERDL